MGVDLFLAREVQVDRTLADLGFLCDLFDRYVLPVILVKKTKSRLENVLLAAAEVTFFALGDAHGPWSSYDPRSTKSMSRHRPLLTARIHRFGRKGSGLGRGERIGRSVAVGASCNLEIR